MYVYLQALESEIDAPDSEGRIKYKVDENHKRVFAATPRPMGAYVTFYKGSTKVMETPPVKVTTGMDPHSRMLPMKLSFALDKLKPGEYNCQVTVLDPIGQKAAFWQAPVMMIP
jgi:hypothetical protein